MADNTNLTAKSLAVEYEQKFYDDVKGILMKIAPDTRLYVGYEESCKSVGWLIFDGYAMDSRGLCLTVPPVKSEANAQLLHLAGHVAETITRTPFASHSMFTLELCPGGDLDQVVALLRIFTPSGAKTWDVLLSMPRCHRDVEETFYKILGDTIDASGMSAKWVSGMETLRVMINENYPSRVQHHEASMSISRDYFNFSVPADEHERFEAFQNVAGWIVDYLKTKADSFSTDTHVITISQGADASIASAAVTTFTPWVNPLAESAQEKEASLDGQ